MSRTLLALVLLVAAPPALAQTPCAPNNAVFPAAGVNCKADGRSPAQSAPLAKSGVMGAIHDKLETARSIKADKLIAAGQCDKAHSYAATQRSLALTQHVDKACLPKEKHS